MSDPFENVAPLNISGAIYGITPYISLFDVLFACCDNPKSPINHVWYDDNNIFPLWKSRCIKFFL